MTKPNIVPTWGTEQGGDVATGLVPTSAIFYGTEVVSGVTYGLIDYTLSGSPDLSDVLTYHRLTVSGFTLNANNASNMVIVAKDQANFKLRVRSTSRTTDSLDESGISGSATVTTDGSQKQTPAIQKQAQGHNPGEKPSAQVENWWKNKVGEWVTWLNSQTDGNYLIGRRLTAGENVTLIDNEDGTERIDVEISDTPFSVESHGFTLGQAIRWNGSSWVLAQGDTEANSTDVWLVTGVPDVDTFFAYKTGRCTATGHGLGSAGDTLYLSDDTAGALTSARPDSDYYLPVCTVVDANTLDIAIELVPRYERLPLILATGSGTVPNTGSPDYENINATVDLSKKANQRLRFVGRLERGSQSAYFLFSNISYTGRSGRTIAKEYSTGTSNPSVSAISTNSDTELRIYVAGISSNAFSGDYLFDFEIIYDPDAATIRVIENTQGSSGEIKSFAKFTGVTLTDTPLLYRVYADNFDPYEFTLERDC